MLTEESRPGLRGFSRSRTEPCRILFRSNCCWEKRLCAAVPLVPATAVEVLLMGEVNWARLVLLAKDDIYSRYAAACAFPLLTTI